MQSPAEIAATYEQAVEKTIAQFPGCCKDESGTRIMLTCSLLDGDTGLINLVFGKTFTEALLDNIGWVDDVACLVALKEAAEEGRSIENMQGRRDFESLGTPAFLTREHTPETVWPSDAYLASLTPEAWAPRKTAEEMWFLELLKKAYLLHRDALPVAFRLTQDHQPADFTFEQMQWDEYPSYLALGMAGVIVDLLGRDFCRHLKTMLEAAEKFELCRLLDNAINDGVCMWDTLGHLPVDSPETNLYH